MNQRLQGALIGGAIVAAGFLLVDYFGTGSLRTALVSNTRTELLKRGERILDHSKVASGYYVLIVKD